MKYLPGVTAGEDVDGDLFATMGTADKTIVKADSGDDVILGVIRFKAKSGTPVTVQIDDEAEVEAGAAIARGKKVMADANGRAVVATTGKQVGGIALTAGKAPVSKVYSRLRILITPGALFD